MSRAVKLREPVLSRQEAFVWIAHAHIAMAVITGFPYELLKQPALDLGDMLLSGVPVHAIRSGLLTTKPGLRREWAEARKLRAFVRRVLLHTVDTGEYCEARA